MGFLKQWLQKQFYTTMEVNCSETLNNHGGGFWSNPVFQDPKVKDLTKKYLLHIGHCPVCDDFLFIDIIKEDYENYYNVTKYCISNKCNYTKDISQEFNKHLGLTKHIQYDDTIRLVNPPSHYYSLEIEQGKGNIPLTTGHLQKSFYQEIQRNSQGLKVGFNKNKELTKELVHIQTVQELPQAKNYGNIIFICKGNEYISIKQDNNTYKWIIIGRHIPDIKNITQF